MLGLGVGDGGGRVIREARREQTEKRRLARIARHRDGHEQRARPRVGRQRRETRGGLRGLDFNREPVVGARWLGWERRVGLEHAQFADAAEHGAEGDGLLEGEQILQAGGGFT